MRALPPLTTSGYPTRPRNLPASCVSSSKPNTVQALAVRIERADGDVERGRRSASLVRGHESKPAIEVEGGKRAVDQCSGAVGNAHRVARRRKPDAGAL